MNYELRVMSPERGIINHKLLAISDDEVKYGF
jgi:hypothetical protein